MRVIKELVDYYNEIMSGIEKNRFKASMNAKEFRMWDYLSKNKDGPNEVTLAKDLYNVANPSNSSYQELKRTFRRKLKDKEILDISGPSLQRKKKEILKEYIVIKSMELKGLRQDLIKSCKDLLKKAETYQMYVIAADLLHIMASHCSVYGGEFRKADEYRQLASLYTENVAKERKVEAEYSEVIEIYQNNNDATLNASIIKSYADNIDLTSDNHRLHFFYYFIRTIQYHVSGDVDSRISACKEAITYFQNLHFRHSMAISIFRLRLINAYLKRMKSGDLAMVEVIIGSELSETDKTKHDILLLKHELIRVKCLRGRYNKAYTLIKSIDRKKVVNEHESNLLAIDMLLLQIVNDDLDQVNMRKIKHNTKFAQADKAGLGLSLLIAECVYYVMTGRASLIEDRKRNINRFIYDNLDVNTQLKEIELLNLMTGSNMVLSEPYTPDDRMIVPCGDA